MAGQLTIDTLKASSGVLATQNGMTGIAKAWVNFNSTGPAIRSSFNVSSVTTTGTGLFTINFTTALADANYSVTTSGSSDSTTQYISFIDGNASVMTTTSLKISTCNPNVGNINRAVNCITIHGN